MWEQGPGLGQQLGHSVQRLGWGGWALGEDAPPEWGHLIRFRCIIALK